MFDDPFLFEMIVAYLFNADHNVKIDCDYNQEPLKRQFDGYKKIWIEDTLSVITIGIECKKTRRPVGIDRVEAFKTKLERCKINKGIMVSFAGYQSGAEKSAKEFGIDLYNFRPCTFEDMDGTTLELAIEVSSAIPFHARANFSFPFKPSEFALEHDDIIKKDGTRIGDYNDLALSVILNEIMNKKKGHGFIKKDLSDEDVYFQMLIDQRSMKIKAESIEIKYSTQQCVLVTPRLSNPNDWYIMENIQNGRRRLITRFTVEKIRNTYSLSNQE